MRVLQRMFHVCDIHLKTTPKNCEVVAVSRIRGDLIAEVEGLVQGLYRAIAQRHEVKNKDYE